MKKLVCALIVLALCVAFASSETVVPSATEVPLLFRFDAVPTQTPATQAPVPTEVAPLFAPETAQDTASDVPKETEVPALFAPEQAKSILTGIDVSAKEMSIYKVGNRFLVLPHIYAISEAFDGSADILFETMSDTERKNPGMLMIYKYSKDDAFPVMSLTFCGEADEDHGIERIFIVTDRNVYGLAVKDYAACQTDDEYRTYLFADAGNIMMNRENAKVIREFLDSEDSAIVVGNKEPYCIYTLSEDEKDLLNAVAEEWEEIWNDEWYSSLDSASRQTLETVFPTLHRSARGEGDIITLIENLYYEPYPELERSSRGDDVVMLQKALDTLGYDIGKIDGVFGENTENALRAFQELMGFDPTGIADDSTQRKLYKIINEGPAEEIFKDVKPAEKTVELKNVEVYSLEVAPDEENAVVEARNIEIAPDKVKTAE